MRKAFVLMVCLGCGGGSSSTPDLSSGDLAAENHDLAISDSAASSDSLPADLASATDLSLPGATIMFNTTLNPGGELTECQDFAAPFSGANELAAFVSTISGSADVFLYAQPNATNGVKASCSSGVLSNRTLLYVSHAPSSGLQFPAGVSEHLDASTGFTLQVHSINLTGNVVPVTASITAYPTAATGTTQAGMVAFPVTGTISANAMTLLHKTCSNLPSGLSLVAGTAELDTLSPALAAYGSTMDYQSLTSFYSDSDWTNNPTTELTPVVPLSSLIVDCQYNNTSPNTRAFGNSYTTNELCVFYGYYTPAQSTPTFICTGS